MITEYRDRGCPELEPLSPELIREMMDWAACEHVPDDYLALVSEELDLDGVDPRRPAALPSNERMTSRSSWWDAANRASWRESG